ncbi:hypothetical protein [Streptomyces poonensis]|uniref:Uncharacterized protein n=1 Tax=Streptomyces poonensis TaxID=68255 RepID=A0A918PDY8_9ACTN|nr:hypothetical protein [Streptomyces poonensis]GGY99933.1 hypothetical protein GCM10010365_18370 [Streptomyces poonensis]GLJ92174.1 hypothetical protein GCM10017589_47830 [Streptomyces poonensis]
MAKSPAARATAPDSVWLARGRHTGTTPAEELIRHRLAELKSTEAIQDHLEFDGPDDDSDSGRRAFEARWLVAGDVVVRARMTVGPPDGRDGAQEWVLAAEAERPWELGWPSPATVFWPEDEYVAWDQDVVPGLRFRTTNPLPTDDKELRRLLRDCVRRSGSIHVVVHEAMTPDERGRRPLTPLLPPSLRHRVVEHRAAPDQFQIVNWVLDDLGARVPRGGAVVLPSTPPRPGYDAGDFAVRTVFLDGSEPAELIDTVLRYAALPRPLPEWAEEAVTGLREQWHLMTLEEELAQARALVATYAEALEAMTKSRDLYREAAERAHEALSAYREGNGTLPAPREEPRPRERFSLRALTKPLERARAGLLAASSESRSETEPETVPAPASAPKPEAETEPDREGVKEST